MACFWMHQNETSISIPTTHDIGSITFYNIFINVANIQWTVSHRYSEFYELHNQLVLEHGLSKDILPPKRVIRNRCPIFVETRKNALETYLRSVLSYLKHTMPQIFLEFLSFHEYDTFFLLQGLAFQFYSKGDCILSTTKSYTFNPLQLYSISECLKNPFPVVQQSDSRYDISHALDFCSQLHHLDIVGCAEPLLPSNIVPNTLKFELSSFKSLQSLELHDAVLDNVYSLGNLRFSVLKLVAHRSKITAISQVLQCDMLHKYVIDGSQVWESLIEIDLSNNNLTEIDNSIKLAPNLKSLVLNHNKLSSISNLTSLLHLTHLSVSYNLISICDHLHTKLGNILSLDLSQNSISSLEGVSKLYSLECLDVSCNNVSCFDDISCIGSLPCLENLILTGNSVTTTIDYRIKILEIFEERAKEICLDNERPSQQELDKVAILKALRIAKEGRSPSFNHGLNSSFF